MLLPRSLKIFAAAIVLAVSVSGCTQFRQFQAGVESISSANVSPTMVVVAANTFNAVEAAATIYLQRPRCTGSNGPICRSPVATKRIIPAIRSGRVARVNLMQFLKDHPNELGPRGVYDALTASIDTVKTAIAQYP